jgi:hypothetical protein
LGEGKQGIEVVCGKGHILDGAAIGAEAFKSSAGIAGGTPHLGGEGRLGQFPNHGVFATARADDKQLHEEGSETGSVSRRKAFFGLCGGSFVPTLAFSGGCE